MISLLISALLTRIVWPESIIESYTETGVKDALLNVYYDFTREPFYLKENYISVYSAATVYYGNFNDLIQASVPAAYVQRFFLMLAQMNLGLAVFNLLPVPPLDGFRFMDQFVFKGQMRLTPQQMQYIHLGFLVVLMTGLLSGLLTTVNRTVFGWFSQLFALLI